MSGFLRPLRRRLRAWRAVRRLQAEGARYEALFRARHLSIPDDAAIRGACAARRRSVRIETSDPVHVLAIYSDFGWENAALGGTLRRMGRLTHVDYLDPAFGLGHAPRTRAYDRALHRTVLACARRAHAEQPIDAVFAYVSGEHVTTGLLEELRSIGAPMVNLSLNDKEWFVGRVRRGRAHGVRDIGSRFDLCWTSTIDAVPKYVVEGAVPVYLPEGANPAVHAPVDVARDIDVSFVGQCYDPRPAHVEALRRAGISVQAFGPGWPAGRVTLDEMVRIWCRSRVTLGFSGVLGHAGSHCLKGRDFEVPMSGGLYLTEHHEELAPFYRIGSEILTWRDTDELVQRVRWVLANPDQAEGVRAAGRARALADHTWDARFRRVFGLMGVRGFDAPRAALP
jgi:hypothetical protein